MIPTGQDSLRTRSTVEVEGTSYAYYSLAKAAEVLGDISRLPFSMKVLLENLLRFEDGVSVTRDDLQAMVDWQKERRISREIQYRPARVLMQDFTGVPAVVDLAAMRDAMKSLGGNPQKINPLVPVHLIIDHSVMVDEFGTPKSFGKNVELEYVRNGERYEFLKWATQAFDNFQVVPPGTGICHQVNLEHIAQCVWTDQDSNGETLAYPDTLVGTDSHTTMVNGLGVLGWGVGGIEAEAAMLGQPVSMLIPEVVGFRLDGQLKEGITATDLVLTVTQMLRQKGVVGRFVEFYGPGLDTMTVADRATIANMAPEYGATCGFFPLDQRTLDYLELTGREPDRIALVRAYAQVQGLWRDASTPEPAFTDTLELDMGTIEPSLAGPKRPQDRVLLSDVDDQFNHELEHTYNKHNEPRVPIEGTDTDLGNGDVVIAAITSCTNTSNPSVLVAAGLVARKARALGLTSKPWVKTSLAPGSQVVTDYLNESGLSEDLNALGFDLVGYGCTTCIGNSGPLAEPISKAINDKDLVAVSVLSGNRNFEGRVSPDCRANYLASPPLVVAFALKGTVRSDMVSEPIGTGTNGKPVFLKDIWPSNAEVRALVDAHVHSAMFRRRYADVYHGDERWRAIAVTGSATYSWPSEFYLHPEPALFHRHDDDPGAAPGHCPRPGPGGLREFDHHRPHLAGRRDQARQSRGALPSGAPGQPRRIQQLRRAPREPRSDDARHLRQHPHPQPDARQCRGRVHALCPDRRSDADLRRRHALQARQPAARRRRGQGIWHRKLARLGRQGHGAARRARGHRRELRAHPSLEPRRHGRAAAAIRRRRECRKPGHRRQREILDRRRCRAEAEAGCGGRRQAPGQERIHDHRALPHRHL